MEDKNLHIAFIITEYPANCFKNSVGGIGTFTYNLAKELEDKNILSPTIKDISNAVIAIRKSKLPDPKKLGNSGSFFKNPVITQQEFEIFIAKYPEAPNYKVSQNEIKIPAGWLIEKSGFKGKQYGNAGVHEKQALVLVNHGNASGKEIWNLAMKIRSTVKEKFGIEHIHNQ